MSPQAEKLKQQWKDQREATARFTEYYAAIGLAHSRGDAATVAYYLHYVYTGEWNACRAAKSLDNQGAVVVR